MNGCMRGYSLLEMLVVLTIFGLVSGMAIPAVSSAYNAWQWRSMQRDVLTRIADLSVQALIQGRTFQLPDDDVLDLPADLELTFEPELLINSRGVCMGSRVTMTYKDRQRSYQLEPPLCQVGGP